jgi:hypothetical protein
MRLTSHYVYLVVYTRARTYDGSVFVLSEATHDLHKNTIFFFFLLNGSFSVADNACFIYIYIYIIYVLLYAGLQTTADKPWDG